MTRCWWFSFSLCVRFYWIINFLLFGAQSLSQYISQIRNGCISATSVTSLVVTFSFQDFSLWLFCSFTYHRISERGEHVYEYRVVLFGRLFSVFLCTFSISDSMSLGRNYIAQSEESSKMPKKNTISEAIIINYGWKQSSDLNQNPPVCFDIHIKKNCSSYVMRLILV